MIGRGMDPDALSAAGELGARRAGRQAGKAGQGKARGLAGTPGASGDGCKALRRRGSGSFSAA